MKELLFLNEAVVWSFFAGVAVTGILCGLIFRAFCGRLRRRKEEKTVYLAMQEGTIPVDGMVLDGVLDDDASGNSGGRG